MPAKIEDVPTIHRLFHIALHTSALSRMPSGKPSVSSPRPIHQSVVKFDGEKSPGRRIRVDRVSTSIGMATLAAKSAAHANVAGPRIRRSGSTAPALPLLPDIVTKRLA